MRWRVLLYTLVFMFILYPQVTPELVMATDPDVEPSMSTNAPFFFDADPDDAENGYTLIGPYNGRNVYLVDDDGKTVHTWRCSQANTGTVKLLADGTLLRGRTGAAGAAYGVQMLDWNGTVLWDYTPPSPYRIHHDIEPMPNGNLLLNAWTDLNYSQAIALGRDPDNTPPIMAIEPVIEIRPKGTNGADIVWVWDPLDHIVQDVNPDLPNFGIVSEHPELIDLNYPPGGSDEWQHSNSVSYNPELDQIIITDRNFDEMWIIDHNTTIEEAAGHSGGAQGRGGDLLYRWGNPLAYGSGDADDRTLFGPHDAQWIEPGLPGEGNILVFNNGIGSNTNRPGGNYTTVDEFTPPLNSTGGYDMGSDAIYGPSGLMWSYNASPPEALSAWAMGGAQRLPNGNTLICGGSSRKNLEVTSGGETVWQYNSHSAFQIGRYYPPGMDIPPTLNATEDVILRMNVSSLMSDKDTEHGDLRLGVNSPFAHVNGHELVLLYPEGIRIDLINLTVSDGIFTVGTEIRVDVAPVNDPPFLVPVPTIEATEGVPYLLGMDEHVLDPDTPKDRMTIRVDSPYVAVGDWELRFLYPNGVLSDSFELTVDDGEFQVSTGITVNVTPVNDPPSAGPVPDQVGKEDVPWTVDLGEHITDIDSPIDDITLTTTSRYLSISGLSVTFLYPEGVTQDVVFLVVSDGESGTGITINITIEPVNDAPVLGDLLPLQVTEDETSYLDLGPSIDDPDTPREDLTVIVGSPYVEVRDHELVLLYPDGVHEDVLTIQVSDGDSVSTTTLVVKVIPVNDPPVFLGIPRLSLVEDVPFRLDLAPSIQDVDTPLEALSIWFDSPFVKAEGHTLILQYPEGVLHDEVLVEVSDGYLECTMTLVIDVEPVNDPPWWTPLEDVYAVEDKEGEVYVDYFINDIETPALDLVVEVSSAHGWMDGHVFRYSYPDGVLGERVTFTLTDGEFLVTQEMNVTVSPVNDPPELSGARADPVVGGPDGVVRFSVVLTDIDLGSDVPVVTVVVDGVTHVCTRVDTDTGPYHEGVTFELQTGLGPGIHTYRFMAEDGDGGQATTEPLTIQVKAPRDDGEGSSVMFVLALVLTICAVAALAALISIRRRSHKD